MTDTTMPDSFDEMGDKIVDAWAANPSPPSPVPNHERRAYWPLREAIATALRQQYAEQAVGRAASAIVAELVALIPLAETLDAAKTGETLIAYFKAKLAESAKLREALEPLRSFVMVAYDETLTMDPDDTVVMCQWPMETGAIIKLRAALNEDKP